MKLAHFIEMRVFSKENDNEDLIKEKILNLFPFDFKEEKIEVISKTVEGFENKKIKISTVSIKKQRHTTAFIKNLMKNLDLDQKKLLINQLESRLDKSLHFYIRFDKEKLLEDKFFITESGNCFHLNIAIAAYPHKRETAIDIVTAMIKNEWN